MWRERTREKERGLGYTVNSRLWGRVLSRWPRSLVPSCFMALTACQRKQPSHVDSCAQEAARARGAERDEERTFVFHFAPHLHQCPAFFPLYTHSFQISGLWSVCSLHLQKYHKRIKKLTLAFNSLDDIYMSVCLKCVCF